jgi:hypothetical protein
MLFPAENSVSELPQVNLNESPVSQGWYSSPNSSRRRLFAYGLNRYVSFFVEHSFTFFSPPSFIVNTWSILRSADLDVSNLKPQRKVRIWHDKAYVGYVLVALWVIPPIIIKDHFVCI